jgi:hypothetical protein
LLPSSPSVTATAASLTRIRDGISTLRFSDA